MAKHGICQILNTYTGDSYVGSAVDLTKRMNQHKSYLRNNNSDHRKLQRAWNKYGAFNFKFLVLEEIHDANMLIEREQFYIDQISPKYNIRKQAESNLGLSDLPETKKKKSASARMRGQSEPQMEALRGAQNRRIGVPVIGKVKDSLRLGPESLRGKALSAETKKKISEALRGRISYWKGKTLPEDVKKKISKMKRGKPWTEARRKAHVRKQDKAPSDV